MSVTVSICFNPRARAGRDVKLYDLQTKDLLEVKYYGYYDYEKVLEDLQLLDYEITEI